MTWYAALVRTDGGSELPWMALPLLAAYVPFHVQRARREGASIGFWWLNLFAALAFGIVSQLFYREWTMVHVLGLVALSAAFTLVPWLAPRPELRTWPWVLVGGLGQLVIFFIFSFRAVWEELLREPARNIGRDLVPISIVLAITFGAYIMAARRRKILERWPYPEGLALFLIAYVAGLASPAIAVMLINLALLAMGVVTVRQGIERGSLRRMNLGLAVLSQTILLRFFDTDLSFVVRGLVFIAIGVGFLFMNLRLVRQRQRHGGTH